MVHSVTVPRRVDIEEYYVLRGIIDDCGIKKVIKEREFSSRLTLADIATFLEDTKAHFCSMENNYRLSDGELPFM